MNCQGCVFLNISGVCMAPNTYPCSFMFNPNAITEYSDATLRVMNDPLFQCVDISLQIGNVALARDLANKVGQRQQVAHSDVWRIVRQDWDDIDILEPFD